MKISRPKSILAVAGEASGDMHAAKVIEALRAKDKKLRVFGLGGPLMAKAGMEVREDMTRRAIMGLTEVVKHLPQSLKRLRACEQWMQQEKPDLLLLVDYPGFNLALAQRARRLGIPVCYYIAPKVWAWREGRVEALRRTVQRLLVIFPFEKGYFRKKGIEARYVGNPLMEEMDLSALKREPVLEKNGIKASHFPLVCAMPGSRKSEVGKLWPLFLKASRMLRKLCPDAAFIVPQPHGLSHGDYPGLKAEDSFYFVEAPAYDLRKACDLAWIKSGTSTLETALLGTPMVVVYKVAAVTGFLAKRLLKVKNVSLVNLLAGREVVKELLQGQASPKRLLKETLALLEEKTVRDDQTKAFKRIRQDISKPPKASKNAAMEILKMLRSKS